MIMKLLLACLVLAMSAFGQPLKLMTENLPPYSYFEADVLKGISVEMVRKILPILGYEDASIEVYPWSRALALLEAHENGVLFSMAYTQERAQKYKFACTLIPVEVFLFKHKEDPRVFTSREEISSVSKIGVVKDFGAHKWLKRQGFTNLDLSSQTQTMLQKLLRKKVDLIPATPMSIAAMHDARIDTTRIERTAFKLYQTNLCIAFNQAFSDKEVKRWETALHALHVNGTYETILSRYMKELQQ
jgi:polar amino acid transport system substrate-binding protein